MVSKHILAALLANVASANYTLTKDYSGSSFFSNFDFFTGSDPTNGHVQFVDMGTANLSSLVGFVRTGNSTAAYMGVDNKNVTPNGRPALRITDKATYNHMLAIVDIAHMPTGCGVWPAFWALGTSSPWPGAGEIDILEGVNSQTSNRISLHTNAGVTLSNISTSMTGSILASNCDVAASSNNTGCSIVDPSPLSYGIAFNKNNGGIFAMEYTSSAITVWFFPRGSIPSDIPTNTPNPSTWPAPSAMFQNAAGDLDSHFCELQLIFDTTFCGDWAGNPSVWAADATCSALAPTCVDHVTNDPEAFTEAYWAVNKLQVFQDPKLGLGSKKRWEGPRRHGGGAVLLEKA